MLPASGQVNPRVRTGLTPRKFGGRTADGQYTNQDYAAQGMESKVGVVKKQDRACSATPWFALDEFFDEKFRQARSVMPDDHVLIEQIVQQTAHADRLQFSDISTRTGAALRAL